MIYVRKIIALLTLFALVACASYPDSFVRNQPSNWITIELANGATREAVWGKVADSFKERDLEFEKIDREAGYMRTSWHYVVTKSQQSILDYFVPKKIYATRVIVDFPSTGKIIRVKTEAQYNVDGAWIEGFDTNYSQTIKNELAQILR